MSCFHSYSLLHRGRISMHHRSVPSLPGTYSISTSESDLDSLIFLLLTILPIVSSLPVLLFLRIVVAYPWGTPPLPDPYCQVVRFTFNSGKLLLLLQKTSLNSSGSMGNLFLNFLQISVVFGHLHWVLWNMWSNILYEGFPS